MQLSPSKPGLGWAELTGESTAGEGSTLLLAAASQPGSWGRELSQSRQREAGGGGWLLALQPWGREEREDRACWVMGASSVSTASLGLSPELIALRLLQAPFRIWT